MLPTFLGIGSARCASTWLYHVLRLHPQILMTWEKEVSFFGKMCLEQNLADYKTTLRPDPENPHPLVRGDISPWYARISQQSVAAAHRLMPNGQIILIIRNPIDRAWSHALMELSLYHKREDFLEVKTGEFFQRFERSRQVRFSDYETIIDRWGGCFGSALLVDTYDRVKSDPRGLLRDVLKHIGADPQWEPPIDPAKRVWSIGEVTGGKTDGIKMPDVVRWYLAKQWLEPTLRLNQRLNGRVQNWVDEMTPLANQKVPASWRMKREINRLLMVWPEKVSYALFDSVREMRLARSYRRLDRELAADRAAKQRDASTSKKTSNTESIFQANSVTRLGLAGLFSIVMATMLVLSKVIAGFASVMHGMV